MTTPTPNKCHCAAHNSDECICGAWDDLDPHMLRGKLDQIKRRIFGDHYEANRNEDAVASVAHVMQQLDASRAECARLRTMSTVEMMCENLNVKNHVTEWENRCIKAETEVARLREAMERIRTAVHAIGAGGWIMGLSRVEGMLDAALSAAAQPPERVCRCIGTRRYTDGSCDTCGGKIEEVRT
jgi:hypothetical protein